MQNVATAPSQVWRPARTELELAGAHLCIVETGPERGIERPPRSRGVVVDRRSVGEGQADAAEEEHAGHPLDEVPHDVASDPPLTGSGAVPRTLGNRVRAVREPCGHPVVPLGDLAHVALLGRNG